jgi:hypothetical protein
MPRVSCPECDKVVKVPADYERSFIRCPSCEYKIRLDEDDVARLKNGKPQKRPLKPNKTSQPGGLQAYLGTTWLVDLLPALIVVPLGLFLLALGFVVDAVFPLAACLGLIVPLCAFIMAAVRARQAGHITSIDYLEFLGPIRFPLIFLFLGLYLLGYVVILFVAQVMTAFAKPKVALPWLVLEVFGVVLFIGSMAMHRRHMLAQGPPQIAFNPPPNVGPPPKDPREVNNPPPPKSDNPLKVDAPPAVARVTGDAALDKALADLGHKDFFVRQKAADHLVNMQPNEHRPAVAQYLATLAKSPDAPVRREAIRALGLWATPNELPVLLQFLNDEDIGTRNAVLKNIGRFRDERAAAPVVRCFLEFQTRFNATKALKEMGSIAEKEVLTLLNHQDANIRADAVRVLKDIGTQQSVPALQAAAQSNMFGLRIAAQEALKAIAARNMK